MAETRLIQHAVVSNHVNPKASRTYPSFSLKSADDSGQFLGVQGTAHTLTTEQTGWPQFSSILRRTQETEKLLTATNGRAT